MRAMAFRWIPRGGPFHPNGAEEVHGFPEILKHLVRQRGISDGVGLEAFLRPMLRDLKDPFLIPEMKLAVDRILKAIDDGEKICVFGDYEIPSTS